MFLRLKSKFLLTLSNSSNASLNSACCSSESRSIFSLFFVHNKTQTVYLFFLISLFLCWSYVECLCITYLLVEKACTEVQKKLFLTQYSFYRVCYFRVKFDFLKGCVSDFLFSCDTVCCQVRFFLNPLSWTNPFTSYWKKKSKLNSFNFTIGRSHKLLHLVSSVVNIVYFDWIP